MTALTGPAAERHFLQGVRDRARARVGKFRGLTVAERITALTQFGYHPHGVYVPAVPALNTYLSESLTRIGAIASVDERLGAYFALQAECEQWARDGVPGEWRGQQAIMRSEARFRLACLPRRTGKTDYAAHEAVALAVQRPRTWIWVCAPTWKSVSRCFDIIADLVRSHQFKTTTFRTLEGVQNIVLENGSRIEGMSLDDPASAAGASVDFAILDEAVYLKPRAWTRQVLPVLTDRQGGALILSAWEDAEEFFEQQAKRATEDETGLWQVFTGSTWDNFFMFPQGEDTQSLKDMRAEMTEADYLEQYGGIRKTKQDRIYPQYLKRVHYLPYTPQPDWPVKLVADPASGVAEYAVAAFQDFGDTVWAIDEFYVARALTEHAIAWAQGRPWVGRVESVLIDSASPDEITRWAQAGFKAFGVPHKPEPHDSFPYVERMLRDPVLYRNFWQEKLAAVCGEFGCSPGEYEQLPPDLRAKIALAIEERLAPSHLTEADVQRLRRCSHFFISEACPFMAAEIEKYAYRKRRDQKTITEKPQRDHDHLMDCLRYFAYVYKRWEYEDTPRRDRDLLATQATAQLTVDERQELATHGTLTPQFRRLNWLQQVRAHVRPQRKARSLVRAG